MSVFRKLSAIALVPAVLALAACTSAAATETEAGAADGDVKKVALVLGGLSNDGGFNQYAADAVHTLEEEGLIEVQISESIANPADAEPLFRQYGAQGFDLVIGWGLGFSESVFTVAKELPDTNFIATGANTILEEATDNVETWTYDFNQHGYLQGWVAGKADLDTWGIVDAVLAPYNEPAYEAFRVGIEATNPGTTELQPIFTGSADDTLLANQAAKALISQGADLIVGAAGGNNQGIVSAAIEAGISTIGLSNVASADAPKANLGVVEIDFTPTLREIVGHLVAGEFGNTGYISEIQNKGLIFAPSTEIQNAPAFPSDIAAQVNTLADQLASGDVKLPNFS